MSAYGGTRSIYTNFLGRGREIAFPKYTAMQIGVGNRTSTPMATARQSEQRSVLCPESLHVLRSSKNLSNRGDQMTWPLFVHAVEQRLP
jgi:hypothetical protein